METFRSSKKRKQYTLPSDPCERIYTRRRRENELNSDLRSVKDLRSRRVFSPAFLSGVKGSIKGAENDTYKVGINVERNQENSAIDDTKSKLDLGIGREDKRNGGIAEIDDKEVQSNSEFCGKNQMNGELLQSTPREQNKEMDKRIEKDGKPRSVLKSGVIVPCSRTKLFKNPRLFSYRRLLPFLMDLEKDTLEINPCRKVDNSVEERSPYSMSVRHEIIKDGTNKEVSTSGHPFGASHDSLQVPLNIECSNLVSVEHLHADCTSQNSSETTINSTVDASISTNLSHLNYGSLPEAPQVKADMLNRLAPAGCRPCLPLKPCSLLTSKYSSIKGTAEFEKGCQKDNGNTEIERLHDDDWFQSTPPDSDIFPKPEDCTSNWDALESSMNNRNVNGKNNCPGKVEKDRHSNPKAKSGVFVPSSQMKLVKTPNSFSYRRLLPFLLDLGKIDSSTLRSPLMQKVEKLTDKGPTSSFVVSQETPKDGPNKEKVTSPHPFGSSDASATLESREMTPFSSLSDVGCSNLETIKEPLAKLIIKKTPGNCVVSTVDGSVTKNSPHMFAERASQVQQANMDKSSTTQTVHGANLMIKSPSDVIHEPSCAKVEAVSHCPEVVNDVSVLVQKSSTALKSPGEMSFIEELSSVEPPALSEKILSSPTRGILKRHPVGCRGICTCLSCASFRLHAERAFEFSRNQMQDTEVVAMDLMKELSNIRALLEKSIGDCQAVTTSQVQEACMKALKAEELAKSHLRHMNEELVVHCRTPVCL
ncbi:hypothetical protein FRX31_017973 [Thalictrum thalictroides]|uniref:Uncharacterized protein n=1 Tax=Thalictrum thalictroides TaxID=46969 RepID=A0A7J6W5X0_THATH|nr:hypothetical protein FRX31_017973 [Thalictrum thalictroides]